MKPHLRKRGKDQPVFNDYNDVTPSLVDVQKQEKLKPDLDRTTIPEVTHRTIRKQRKKSRKPQAPSSTYYISAWVFARVMGLLYIIAFVSSWVQIHGLVGSDGISPLTDYYARLESSLTVQYTFYNHPSLFWINQSDLLIHAVCALGTLSATALLLDIIPGIMTLVCWFLLLSINVSGQNFFLFQWDLLLLESGFLLIFFHSFHVKIKPLSQNPRNFHPPDALFWLYRLLLFRIHFARGIQELLGKDRIWRSLAIFNYHFETQQSPTPFAWYFHQLPNLFHQGLAFWVLTVEIGVVFLIFGPQLFRRTACLYIILLQVFYILTGNFGTYHWNVIALCILLLDDALFTKTITYLTSLRRAALKASKTRKNRSSQPRLWHKRLSVTLAVAVIVLTIVPLCGIVSQTGNLSTPKPLLDAYKKVYPWHIVNLYGPFNRIPKERLELIIQGSLDAQTWKDYEFLYKPSSDLTAWPYFVSPHISRLEYMLWVAAQSEYQKEVWISRLLHRVLEDSPSVVNLFRKEPFVEVPEYIRAIRMKYQFTNFQTSSFELTPLLFDASIPKPSNSSAWWGAEFYDIYTPSFSQTIHSMSSRRKNLRSRIQHKAKPK